MASIELQLISRIIKEGPNALQTVSGWGITVEDFKTHEAKNFYIQLMTYYNDPNARGSVPGVKAFQVMYPNFELCDDEFMTTEALCSEVRKNRLILDVKATAAKTIELADAGFPMEAAKQGHSLLSDSVQLGFSKQLDVSLGVAITDIVSNYNLRKAGENFSVASWPWNTLNEVTGGINPDDYVILYGRPKSKKTWVLSHIAAHCFLTNRRILLYTKEMTANNILARVTACILQLPYQELRMGNLEPEQEETLFAFEEELRNDLEMSGRIISLSGKDAPEGGDTISWVKSKVESLKPDICFIDGLYLMSPENVGKKAADWQRIMSISRSCRQMVLDTGVPVIATLQANRKAAGHNNAELDEIAYSDSIGQDATIAARVIAEKGMDSIALVLAGSREFQLEGIRIGGTPATDFEERELLDGRDVLKAKEGDAEEDAKKKVKRTPLTTSKNNQQTKLLKKQLSNVDTST